MERDRPGEIRGRYTPSQLNPTDRPEALGGVRHGSAKPSRVARYEPQKAALKRRTQRGLRGALPLGLSVPDAGGWAVLKVCVEPGYRQRCSPAAGIPAGAAAAFITKTDTGSRVTKLGGSALPQLSQQRRGGKRHLPRGA